MYGLLYRRSHLYFSTVGLAWLAGFANMATVHHSTVNKNLAIQKLKDQATYT